MLKNGNKTINTNTNTYPTKKGICPFTISPIFNLDTDAAEKIFTATGGVIVPITFEIETIIPKWITSIPKDLAIGHNTGTINTAVAIPSKKVPKIKRTIATIIQKVVFPRFIAVIKATNSLEIPEKVKSHEKAVEVAIINNIIADPFAESKTIGTMSLIFTSLYIKIPAINDQTTATAADSVGVNIPEYIPPNIIIGRSKAGIAEKKLFESSSKDIFFSALGHCSLFAK